MKARIMEVLTVHTGYVLMGGALCLKTATMTGSWFLIITGYSSLVLAAGVYIKRWRDKA